MLLTINKVVDWINICYFKKKVCGNFISYKNKEYYTLV